MKKTAEIIIACAIIYGSCATLTIALFHIITGTEPAIDSYIMAITATIVGAGTGWLITKP